ncbi:hypothetical protein PIB30_037693 [Stylosanthes scabra]|uniref:MATH domain-containing protein n=1 Tax=Stylosanthes scabra TaxID=79078 RepID=A0ABU6XFL9_9FABA|nr:hypothetical protein [Stylosanthes scabra]
MKEQEVKVLTNVKFTWTINNFSKVTCDKELYSGTFFTGPYSWRIGLDARRRCSYEHGNFLSVSLYYAGDFVNFPVERRSANFKLSLVNQLESKYTITSRERENVQLNEVEDDYFWYTFIYIHLNSIVDPKDGYLVNDTCIIVAEVSVNDLGLDQNNPRLFMDFKGLCKIKTDYVLLLEEWCSKHHSLIECHRKRKRSERFNESSFTALGKLLHFLKSKKVKDMMDDGACKELQYLWEEVEVRFDDLRWLEPHVKYALTYFEKEAEIEELEGDVADLEENVKSLKAEAIALNADLETTKKELAKAEEGFVVRDLDDELGCEIP